MANLNWHSAVFQGSFNCDNEFKIHSVTLSFFVFVDVVFNNLSPQSNISGSLLFCNLV